MALSIETKRQVKYYIVNNPLASNVDISTMFNIETSVVSTLKSNVKTEALKLKEQTKIIELKKYPNANGVKKEHARNLTVKSVNVTEGKILGLACETCDFELQLRKEVSDKFEFETAECEYKKNEYWNLLETVAKEKLKMSVYKGFLIDILKKATANEYEFVNADFCSQFGTNHVDLQMIIEKDIVKVGGGIAFTVNKRIAAGTSRAIFDLMERLNPKIDIDEMSRVEHSVRTFINRIGGVKYAIETALNYKDTSAMLLIIIRRIA